MSLQSVPRREAVESELLERYGPLLNGRALWQTVGYRSSQAFRKAASRGHLPVRTFRIPGRKGLFAYTSEVASWFAKVGDAGFDAIQGNSGPAAASDADV